MEHDQPDEQSRHAIAPSNPTVSGAHATAPAAFYLTVEHTSIGIAHLDLSGSFLYVNPALCRLTGYTREQLRGFSFQRLFPDVLEEGQPQDGATEGLPEFHQFIMRLLDNAPSTLSLEAQFRRQDGGAEWARLTLTTVLAAAGEPGYVIASIEDISDRKRLEAELQAVGQQPANEMTDPDDDVAADLAATFEAITDLIVVFDVRGRIRRVNQAMREFASRQPTLDAGRRFLNLVDPEGRPLIQEQWVSTRILRGETITGAESVDVLAPTPDVKAETGEQTGVTGPPVLLNISGAPVRDSRGKIIGGVLVLRDVTERRQLERRTHDALRALLQMAETLVSRNLEAGAPTPSQVPAALVPPPHPVAQRLAELAARVLGCQRVGIVALGVGSTRMRPVALVGLPPKEMAHWWAGLDGKDMARFVGAERMRRLRAGEAVQLDLGKPPLRKVARGGPVALGVPLRVGDQLVGGLAIGYAHEPHVYTDDELALAGAVGQLVALVIEQERLLREREEARASSLALQEANRHMEEFLGIAAHELRTPLVSLLLNIELLELWFAGMSPGAEIPEGLMSRLPRVGGVLALMDGQANRLKRLVNDMVDTSRITSGTLELQNQACDLARIVRDAVGEQRQANPQRVISLALPGVAGAEVVQGAATEAGEGEEGSAEGVAPVWVTGDPQRLGQVVTNYLTNALKYSHPDQPVEVRLRKDGPLATVSVTDHGPGLPPEEQSLVWVLFHRASGIPVRSGSGIGLGLGLYISKTIIERHGGEVGVASAVGEGSTFWFTLPLAPQGATDSAEATSAS